MYLEAFSRHQRRNPCRSGSVYCPDPSRIFRDDGPPPAFRAPRGEDLAVGPRGGAAGLNALATHYGLRGLIEGVASSSPLRHVCSTGLGGSSIIKIVYGKIRSATSAPAERRVPPVLG